MIWDDLLSYLSAIWGNARWLLAGGPYFVDTAIKRVAPRFHNYVNTKFSEPARRRAEISVFFCGMFIATFLAWREQHNVALEAANRPQELIASFTMDNSLNLANDLNKIEVIIYNNGTKSSVIDSISLIMNYFSDNKNDVMTRNDICDDPGIAEAASFFEAGMNIVPHEVININKEQNVSLYYYKADRYVTDGASIDPPIVIDAGKSRGLSAYFKVDRSKNNGSNAVVWCPVVKLFDSNGHSFFTVCKGSIIASTKNGYGSGPYALPPVRLLPPPPNNTAIYYDCKPE
jgi:hypothetical protein